MLRYLSFIKTLWLLILVSEALKCKNYGYRKIDNNLRQGKLGPMKDYFKTLTVTVFFILLSNSKNKHAPRIAPNSHDEKQLQRKKTHSEEEGGEDSAISATWIDNSNPFMVTGEVSSTFQVRL